MKQVTDNKSFFFADEEKLIEFGRSFSQQLQGGEVLALTGELGCGKTTFVKGLTQGLGSNTTVTSPTFNLVHRYTRGRIDVIHYDLYRLKKISDLETIDLENELENLNHILAIEWPAIAESFLPPERTFHFTFTEKDNGRGLQLRSPTRTV